MSRNSSKMNELPLMILFVFVSSGSCKNSNISDLLFGDYDSGLRPACDEPWQINATVGIGLRQVIELDEPNQVIKLNLWIRLKWTDCLLTWNASDYGGVSSLVVPFNRIWVPDLTLYDSVSTEFYGMSDYRPTVYSDGTVYYNFPTLLEVLCPVDVSKFPFDSQKCSLQFGSWSYNGLQLDLDPRDQGDKSAMKENVEWDVPKITAKKNVVYYQCCPEPFPDITFDIYLTRKPAYYVTNIIIPSLIITMLTVTGFMLPVESGEKVSLEITVMLAMSVFQLLIADNLPPSADATPWIATFFSFILGLTGVSTVLQVIVINIYFREDKEVPAGLLKYVIAPMCLVAYVTLPNSKDSFCCKTEDAPGNTILEQSTKKNKVDCDSKESKEIPQDHAAIWKCFSVAIDRIGLFLFLVALTVGCSVIFAKITIET